MRIVFIGAIEFSKSILNKLITLDANIVGVCTLKNSTFNNDHVDLTEICTKSNIPVIYTPNINSNESIKWIKEKSPDIIFCFGWSRLLKKGILNIAPHGSVGFHPAALPANRGRHPIIWSIVLGLKSTATTFFYMKLGTDDGDIISQKNIKITDIDDAQSLYKKITRIALNQIEEFVPKMINGQFDRMRQDNSKANYWRKRVTIDGEIDWRMSANSIHNLVRGLTIPYVGAHFDNKGIEVKVWKTKIVKDENYNIEPGKIISVNDKGPLVKTGLNSIRLIKFEPKLTIEAGEYL